MERDERKAASGDAMGRAAPQLGPAAFGPETRAQFVENYPSSERRYATS
jgi:hypothetical protein